MPFMRRHQKKAFAKQAKANASTQLSSLHKVEYKKWKQQMLADRKALYGILDHAERNEAAAGMVDKYTAYLDEWLESGVVHQNDVLVQCCIWAADGQCWDVLFRWADMAIANPELGVLHWFQRDLADTLAEILIKFASEQLKQEQAITVPVEQVAERLLSAQWEVTTAEGKDNHVLKARYGRIAGIKAEAAEDWENAVRFFEWADELKGDIGVKGRLKVAHEKLQQMDDSVELKKVEGSPEDNTGHDLRYPPAEEQDA